MLAAPLLLSVRILLWHGYSGAEEEALGQVVRAWNAAPRPAGREITVQAVGIPFGSLTDKLQAAVPRGHGPDLFIAQHDWLGSFRASGMVRKVDDLLPAGEVLPTLLAPTLAPLRAEGALYGLPLSFKSLVLFYRADQVRAPPASTDELLALCQRLREEQGAPRRYCLAYETGAYFYHAPWLHGFGGAIFPPGSPRPRLDTPAQEQALAFAAGLARRGDIPEECSAALTGELFNHGRAAMVMSGPWFLSQIDSGRRFKVAPLPIVSPTGLPAAPLATIEAGFINPKGAHPREAAAFLRYLVGHEAALMRARAGRQAVATASVWLDEGVRADPVLAAMRAQIDQAVPTDSRPEMRAFWEAGSFALRQAMRGSASPRQALRQAQAQLDLFLRPLPPPRARAPYLILLAGLIVVATLLAWRRGRGRRAREMWRGRRAYAYLFPAALAMLLLVFVPFVVGAALSLYAFEPGGRWRFVGLANFLDILLCRETSVLDPLSFYHTLLVTVLWTVLNVGLHVLIGGSLALLLRDPLLRMRGIYRVLLLLPWAVPNYITALIWKGMFNRQFGAINGILGWLGIAPVSWFSGFLTSLSANIATNVWLGFPFMMVVALGVLAQLPEELEEAAMLDGASAWQRLRHIILPLLGPAILPSVLLGAVWTFNMFNIVFLVSGGEPDGRTEILVSQAYRWAFTRGHRYGYAAAYAVLIFVVLVLQSSLMRRVSDRRPA